MEITSGVLRNNTRETADMAAKKNKYMKSKANIELNKLGISTDQSKIQTRHKSQNITLQNNHKAHHIRSTDMETILNFTDKSKTSDNTHILTLGQ